MRAYAVSRFKEPPQLLEIPVPTADDATLVRVTYAGMNPIDYKLIDMLTETSKYPFVLGIDFAGVVETPAPGSKWNAGDRVFGMARTSGAYAEFAVVPDDRPTEGMVLIPEGVSDEQAAVLPVAGMAALSAVELLKVGPDKTLVIVGAAGAVGSYATQLARARGAKVLAVVRSGSRDEALRLGATEVYPGDLSLAVAQLRRPHSEGVDAVLDLVSDKQAIGVHLKILKPGGAMASSLRAADATWFAQYGITAFNLSAATSPLPLTTGLKTLSQLLKEKAISPHIRLALPLEQTKEALRLLREGSLPGKMLLRMTD